MPSEQKGAYGGHLALLSVRTGGTVRPGRKGFAATRGWGMSMTPTDARRKRDLERRAILPPRTQTERFLGPSGDDTVSKVVDAAVARGDWSGFPWRGWAHRWVPGPDLVRSVAILATGLTLLDLYFVFTDPAAWPLWVRFIEVCIVLTGIWLYGRRVQGLYASRMAERPDRAPPVRRRTR